MPSEAQKKMVRHNNFDFIRLLAAMFVWYGHCYALLSRVDPVARVSAFESFGGLGVTIFFIISGYFITMSCERSGRLANYARNRALRIVPPLFVVVLLSALVLGPWVSSLSAGTYFTHPETWRYLKCLLIFPLQYDLPGVFKDLSLSAVNGSLWTLQHEVRLYVVIGIIGALGALRTRPMLAILIVLYGIRIYGYIGHPDSLFTVRWVKLELAIRLASEFMAGGYLYVSRFPLRGEGVAVAFALAVLSNFLPAVLGNIVFDLCFAYAVIGFGFLKLPLLAAFSRLGDFSYGFYLYAFPMQQLTLHILGRTPHSYLFMFMSFVLTLFCAVMSWHLVEKPALLLKAASTP